MILLKCTAAIASSMLFSLLLATSRPTTANPLSYLTDFKDSKAILSRETNDHKDGKGDDYFVWNIIVRSPGTRKTVTRDIVITVPLSRMAHANKSPQIPVSSLGCTCCPQGYVAEQASLGGGKAVAFCCQENQTDVPCQGPYRVMAKRPLTCPSPGKFSGALCMDYYW